MKRPQPAPITGASGAIASRRKHRARSLLDLRDLAVGEMAGEIGEGEQARLVRVAPEHAGKPRRARLDALARKIGGRVGVGIVRQLAHQAPDIGHGGKTLGGDALHAALERCRPRHRHHRRAHHPRIDQLALGKPFAV